MGRVVAIAVALIILVADRLTKVMIQHSVTPFENIPVIAGWLRIVHTENPGAAFGVLAEGNPFVRASILIGVSSIVLIFVVVALWSRQSSYSSLRARFALGLILGGAVGNLLDRITRGTVTDFIEVFHGGWSFPAFNVADSAITVGAIVLIADLLWARQKAVTQHVS
jgi:signal peptidase II